ncbi:LamB/YcsF family protein [Algoriphagus marincola]|uniref:LamB/YcsF family protein n=1 Tax=Algoriphagus marincola TaxID=264027 RepID=UPI0003FFCE4F|nr:LamB/YcsF family protein [Algoriphagus marincola]
MQKSLQINIDLGEGVPHEKKLIPYLHAASVACGGHYGDRDSIRETVLACGELEKKVGAHPSYPDRKNFGRKSYRMHRMQLLDTLLEQIHLFQEVIQAQEMDFDHIKFHGALYNDAASQPELANWLSEFLYSEFPEIPVFVPPFSEMERAAKFVGLKTRKELFGDRAYTDQLLLLPRTEKGALLTSFEEIEAHISPMLKESKIHTKSGKEIKLSAETICFHGDNPGILDFLPKIFSKW